VPRAMKTSQKPHSAPLSTRIMRVSTGMQKSAGHGGTACMLSLNRFTLQHDGVGIGLDAGCDSNTVAMGLTQEVTATCGYPLKVGSQRNDSSAPTNQRRTMYGRRAGRQHLRVTLYLRTRTIDPRRNRVTLKGSTIRINQASTPLVKMKSQQ
jgi:hypothetical protein